MIAVAKIGGHQAIVQVGDKLEVDKLSTEAGKKVTFETLLVSEEDGKNFTIGTPFIDGVHVEAKVLEHSRGAKIRVFKMKPRKRYRRLHGHRQDYTVIEILSIGSAAKSTAAKEDKEPAEKAKATADKKAPAKKAPASAKATAGKKKVAKPAEKK